MSGDTATDASYLSYQYGDAERLRVRYETHRLYSASPDNFRTWVIDNLDVRPGMRVLDVGCGPGTYHSGLLALGARVAACDFSAGMLHEARAACRRNHYDVALAQASAEALPFPDASFDRVMANHMLYHVPDIARAVAELRRVLRPGALLFAATNGADHMRPLREALVELQALAPELRIDAGERLRFDLETGATWLQGAFDEMERVDASDDLLVPDVEPLMAYLGSTIHLPDPTPPELAARVKRWDRATRERFGRLLEHGPVRVPRAAGYFVAR